MAKMTIGGDPESYMDAPHIQVGGGESGAPGFIASLLDAVGIGRQVAKGPKKKADDKAGAPATTQAVAPPVNIPSLDVAESTFIQPTDWGTEYLKGLKPLTMIDPNTALKGF